MTLIKKPKLIEQEWWYVKCVDQFEKYHKNLTSDEIRVLQRIRERISITKDEDVMILYNESIDILHIAFCRNFPKNKCIFRDRLTEEEESEHPSALGVTEIFEY